MFREEFLKFGLYTEGWKTAVELLGQGASKCLGAERRALSRSNKGESLKSWGCRKTNRSRHRRRAQRQFFQGIWKQRGTKEWDGRMREGLYSGGAGC